MSDLDERVRAELHRHDGSVAATPDTTDLLGDVSRRLSVLHRRHRTRRRRVLVAICVLVVVAGIATGVGLSPTTKLPSGYGTTIDPRAGKGGFTISPTHHLRNNEHVIVRIHGLRPAESVLVLMCAGVPHTFAAGRNVCSAATELNAITSAEGSVSVIYTVKRVFTIGWGYSIDCATYPHGCSIAVVDPYNVFAKDGTGNIEPVVFRPGPAPPPSKVSISVSPAAPFRDGQRVTVSGTGFPANVAVRVAECPINADCSELWKIVQTSGDGTFSTILTIQRTYTFNGNPSPVTYDCDEAFGCFIVSETNSPTDVVYAPGIPVTFDGPAP